MNKPEGFEFRPANDNEMSEFNRLGSYVFANPPGEDDPPSLLQADWTQCAFDGQQLAAISGVYPFVVRMNGGKAQMQGVSMVGTEPTYRRRGLVRQLITDLLHRGKEAGDVASILLASRGAIYQRFGYGHASVSVSYEFDPREVRAFQFQAEDKGRLQRMSKEEAYPLIVQVQKDYSKPRTMRALRADPTWTSFVSDLEKFKAYCMVHFSEQGTADGYCIYRTKYQDDVDQELTIIDFAHNSMSAWRALWENLTSHDLVQRIKWNNVPEDDPAPGILLEPRCIHRKTDDGIYMRLIDARRALECRGYDVDGDMVITIRDDELCPWNNGSWQVSARDGVAAAQATDAEPDIVTDINGLASLISGHSSVSWLQQIGRLTVTDESQLGYHDQFFATRYRPSMSFGF